MASVASWSGQPPVLMAQGVMHPIGHGIGCLIAHDANSNCVVTKVVQGGAASFSGQVFVGDRIMSVDGRYTHRIATDMVGRWFLGEVGTSVTLVLRDPHSGLDRQVSLTRQPLARVGSYGGEVGGIGAVLASDAHGAIVVSRLVYGGAAAQNKPSDFFGEDRLKRYDKILAVDGRSVVGLTPADARPLLVGPVGSVVRLTVKRAKYDVPIDIELRRKANQMQTQFVPVDGPGDPLDRPMSTPLPPTNGYSSTYTPATFTPAKPVTHTPLPHSDPIPQPHPPTLPPPASPVPEYLPIAGGDRKVGVGLVLRERTDGSHSVKRLKPGQAADMCGKIESGDLLTHVDGLDIAVGAPSGLLADLIAGLQGTVVNLTFEKPDGGALSINLLRGGPEYIASVLKQDNRPSTTPAPKPPPASPAAWQPPPPPGEDQEAVGVSLSLDDDYDRLVSDAEYLKAWNQRLKSDLCEASGGLPPSRVQVVGVQRSTGVIVDINILPGPGPSPQIIAANLASQVADPSSLLRTLDTTRSVQRADVHNGPVTPPSNAAVLAGAPQRSDAGTRPESYEDTEGRNWDKAGVGLVLREDQSGRQLVRRLITGQSAAACGLISVGDILSHVDQQPVTSVPSVLALIPGRQGTNVELRFHRPDLISKDYTVSLMRGDPAFLATLDPTPPPEPRHSTRPPVQAPKQAAPPDALLAKKRAAANAPPSVPMPPSATPQSHSGDQRVMVTLKGDQDGGVFPLVLPSTWSAFLSDAADCLGSSELTRVYSDTGVPITGFDEISPGEKLVCHASAKGQFESWSYGLVVKRRYVLKDRMGETGLGQLWSARDTATEVDVVLTEEGDETALAVRDAILSEKGQGPESERRRCREERFLRELHVAQGFTGRHVCGVVDFGLQQGRMFVVCERLTGQTLAEALSSKASEGAVLTEPLVRKIAIEVLYGLAEAGEAGLPHCNLTPYNVFLSSDGVRVLGLGLAGWEPDVITNASYKLPVKALPQYMSPEQISGRLVDTRSDIFSLAVIMFRCLTGRLPFDGPVFVNIVNEITTAPTPSVAESCPTAVSAEICQVMERALSKDPEDRFPTALAMVDALNQ